MANADDIVKDAMAVVAKLSETHEVLSCAIDRETVPQSEYAGFATYSGSDTVSLTVRMKKKSADGHKP